VVTNGVTSEIAGPKTRTPRSRALGLFLGLVAAALAAVGLAWWATSGRFDFQLAQAGLSVAGALLVFPLRTRWIGVGAVAGTALFWLFIVFVKWSLRDLVVP